MPASEAPDAIVEVAAAVIVEGSLVLLTRRSENAHLPGRWEFPGGKMGQGETAFECARREVREETGLEVEPLAELNTTDFDYPERRVKIHFVTCRRTGGTLDPYSQNACWMERDQLGTLQMPEANQGVLQLILENERTRTA